MQDLQECLSLRCANHRTSYYQFLSLRNEDQQNRLLCAECLIPLGNEKNEKDLKELIPLSIAINFPEQLISQMYKDNNATQCKALVFSKRNLEKEFAEFIDKFDQLKGVIENIKNYLKEQLKEYKSLQEQFKKFRESVFEKINYNQFRTLMLQLQELDKQFQSDQYSQVKKELTIIINQMLTKNSNIMTQEFQQVQKNINPCAKQQSSETQKEQFQKQISEIFEQSDEFLRRLNQDISVQCSYSKLLTFDYSLKIEQKIEKDSKKLIKQKNLIYQGSRDGLDGQSFWSKVNGRANLQMIFQSKNQGTNICGAFSPCVWQQNVQGHVQDDTVTSFIFSQTHNEIFPLKQEKKQFAIYCYPPYGPTFGQSGDIYIASNFVDNCSKLGDSYYWDKYQNKQSELLFGGDKPNIGECEVFELIFS